MSVAVVTGASRGLGRALAQALLTRGWRVVVDARDGGALREAAEGVTGLVPVVGDVTDARHRVELVAAAGGPIDLLVNNASELGPSPMPALATYPLDHLRRVFEANAIAPLALIQLALPQLSAKATIVNVTSDAAVEPYAGWGGYGSSKAALEQLTAILAAEHPHFRIYSVDPGDMRTRMHQEAGSAEMASAGRPFSPELVTELLSVGVLFAPVTLDAGVSSLEHDEMPFPERYEVPAQCARLVNAVRGWGGRVIAVGTTVTRALETVTTPAGVALPAPAGPTS